MMKIQLLIFLAFSACVLSQPDLVIEVFRHGARAPVNATYDLDNYWAGNYGELTGVGMRMHYILGMALNEDYPQLLGGGYNPATIYARSTDVNRTIMSAYSQLYGIYNGTGPGLGTTYPAGKAIPPYANDSILDIVNNLSNSYAIPYNFQPIPVHVVEAAYDTLLLSQSQACSSSSQYQLQNWANPNVSQVYNSLSDTVTYLQSQNLNVSSLADLYQIGDISVCNYYANTTLPGNIEPLSEVYKDVLFAFQYYFTLSIQGQAIQNQMNSYNLLYSVYNYMNATLNGTSSLKFVFFSAHDSTLTSILSALGFVTPDCIWSNYINAKNDQPLGSPYCIYPNFAANVKFELYTNNSNPYVRFLYNDTALPICNGGTDCDFPSFLDYIVSVTNNATLDDFNNYCNPAAPAPTYTSAKTLAIILGITSGLLMFALIYVCMSKPKSNYDDEEVVGHGYSLQGNAV